MPGLIAWLAALAGHWEHWAGGVAVAAAVTATAYCAERFWGRRLARRFCGLLFAGCFIADAAFMTWRDQEQASFSAVPVYIPPTATAEPPPAGAVAAQPAPIEGAVSRDRSLAFSNEIMRFYVSRDIMQPRPLRTGEPGSPEWTAVEEARTAYQEETVREFQARFGSELLLLLERLNEQHLDTAKIDIMYRELKDPQGIKGIWIKLSAVSKE